MGFLGLTVFNGCIDFMGLIACVAISQRTLQSENAAHSPALLCWGSCLLTGIHLLRVFVFPFWFNNLVKVIRYEFHAWCSA